MQRDSKENILYKLKENKELIITFFTALFVVSKEIFHYMYLNNAEKFYGVPKIYFDDNLIDNYIMNIIFLIASIVILFSPIIIKIFPEYKLKKIENIMISVLISLLILFALWTLCDEYVIVFFDTSKNYGIVLLICLALSIFSGVIYYLVFNAVCSDDSPNQKNNIIYNINVYIAIFIMFIIIFLLSRADNITHKKDYEFVENTNSEYNVIVGKYKDSVILMKGNIDSKGNFEIEKFHYRIESIEGKNLGYYQFKSVKCKSK